MDRRIGAQYFTLRDFCKTVDDFKRTCDKVSSIGYKIIQVSGTPLEAEEMRPIIDEYGLQVVVTHKSYDDFVNRPDYIAEYNKTLGCEICGIGSMPDEYRTCSNKVSEFIAGMNTAAERLREEGLYLGYHNHAFEFSRMDGGFMMDRLIKETNPETVKFIVDTYWLQLGGQTPAEYIKKLSERAVAIHFKDVKPNFDYTVEMAEIGQGSLDWDTIIAACEEAGAKWVLVEQDTCKRDPFESLKMSYEFLKAKGFY